MRTENWAARVVLSSLALAIATSCFAADDFLADRHAKKGIACNMCHVKSPTEKPVMGDCLKCHGGSYAELAKRTDKGDLNMHETHLGEAQCSECHSGHKQPRLVCDSCHEDFGNVRVP